MFALCEQIAIEKDQQKFLRLIQELNDLLQHKEYRLKNSRTDKNHSARHGSVRQKPA